MEGRFTFQKALAPAKERESVCVCKNCWRRDWNIMSVGGEEASAKTSAK